jgi:hypothetical protein
MTIERKSDGKQESSKDILSSINMKSLTNIATSSKKQRSFSEIIQNFKNLFYQELFIISNTNKIFIVYKKIKHVVLIYILNTIIKQLEAAQQPAARHELPVIYTNTMKRDLIIIKKSVFK